MNAAGGINPSTAGVEQPLEVNFVRVLAQEKSVLTHDESPHGVIDRRVIVVTLIDGELQKMLRCGGDGRIIQADPAGSFHPHPPFQKYDRFAKRARVIHR